MTASASGGDYGWQRLVNRPNWWEDHPAACTCASCQKSRADWVKVRAAGKVGRNAPCPCGSGKKFKKCHGGVGR